jgi:hypothetical protein
MLQRENGPIPPEFRLWKAMEGEDEGWYVQLRLTSHEYFTNNHKGISTQLQRQEIGLYPLRPVEVFLLMRWGWESLCLL